jgi:hypothetical protein
MAKVDPSDQQELNKLVEEYIQLAQQSLRISERDAKLRADVAKQQGTLNAEIEVFNDRLEDVVYKAESLAKSFSESLAELKNQNVVLQQGKATFKDLTDIAQDLSYYQRGITDLSEKDLKKKEESIGKSILQLKYTQQQLGVKNAAGEFEYKQQRQLNALEALKAQNGNKLSKDLEARLTNLQKESDLLNATNDALKEGINNINQELDVAKQLQKTITNVGGVAGAAAKTLSDFGGSLAKYLDISEASDAVRTFTKNLINDKLMSKEVTDEIQKIEDQRVATLQRSAAIQAQINQLNQQLQQNSLESNKLAAELVAYDAKRLDLTQQLTAATQAGDRVEQNRLIQQIQSLDSSNERRDIENKINANNLKAQNTILQLGTKEKEQLEEEKKIKQDLAKLDEKEAKVKEEAIKSVDTFSNKFKALGEFTKVAVGGLTKAFKDPGTAITALIELGFKADRQVTELGKSLGVSKSEANGMRNEMATFARESGDAFVNTDRLLKAQAELSQELGIAVQFSGKELETFSKLTEIVGLSTQEASKLTLQSKLSGQENDKYVASLRRGAFEAQQATKTHFSDREILKEISGLSAGIAIKFKGSGDALGRAVVEAKKMGSSLEQVNKIGDSLLNWESSVENELKAELMTGKQLNLERARAAALSNDQLALTREISSQIGTAADYSKMNVLAQQSLAEAFGLSRDEMSEMLMKQEAVNTYGDKAAELNKEQLEDMKRQGLSADEYIEKQSEQRAAQDKFSDAMIKLQTIFANLVDGPVGMLLDALADMVGFVTSLTSKWYIFYPLIGLVALNYLPKMLGGFSGIASSLGGIFSGAKSGFSSIMGGLKGLKEGIKSAFSGGGIKGFFGKVKAGFTGIKPPTPSKSQFAGGSFSKGKELVAKKQAETAATGSKSQFAGGSFSKGKELVAKKQAETAATGEKTSTAAKSGGDNAKGFAERMKNIAAGIKAFANVKVLLGALNLIPASIGLIAFIPGALGARIIQTIDGKKLKESLQGIANGIKAFADGSVLLGALGLIPASLGLISMIPGAIGARIIQTIDGKKLKESLKGIAEGIKTFGDGKVLLGALGLIPASLGLVVMIPGVLGAKLIEQIDGKKFIEALSGVAEGISAMGESKVLLGSLGLITSSLGLIAMIPGVLGAKLIEQINGKKLKESLSGLASGISEMGNGKTIIGALALLPISLGLITMIPGVLGAKAIEQINGKKLKDSLTNLASGISELGTGKTIIGALSLIPVSIGLIAMIPGVLGAKLIEQINGKKLKESLSGLSSGISEMGSGKVLLGSLALIPASIGLIAMIPGVIGAKLIEQINGEKFQKSMEGVANGIKAFGDNVNLGSLGKLALGGLALDLFALGTPGMLLLQYIDGEAFTSAMEGIGAGIASYSENVTMGALGKLALGGPALLLFSLATPGLLLLQFVNGTLIEKTLKGIGKGIAAFSQNVSYGDLIKGAVAIALLGASLIPAAFAFQMFADVSWEDMAKAGVALLGLGIAGAIFGSFMPLMLMGAIAIAALGASLIPFGIALRIIAPALGKFTPLIEAFGNVISKVFSGIATVITAAANGISTIFTSLQSVDISKLLAIGPALIAIGVGLVALGGGGVMAAIGSFLGGDPIKKIERLAKSGDGLMKTATELQGVASALTQLLTSLASLDISKLDAVAPALKTIGEAVLFLGAGAVMSAIGKLLGGDSPSKMITDIAASASGITQAATGIQLMASSITQLSTSLNSLDISKLEKIAEIGNGGGITSLFSSMFSKITSVIGGSEVANGLPSVTTNPISTPSSTTTSNTSSTIESSTIQSGVDLTPMIAAIKEVKASIDRLYAKDQSINMDGTKVGTTLTQGSYKVA